MLTQDVCLYRDDEVLTYTARAGTKPSRFYCLQLETFRAVPDIYRLCGR